jgi:predicted RNase H-like HicB family nuclease
MAKGIQAPERVSEIVARPYARVLTPDIESGGFVARVLEFQGVFSEGETPDEAIAMVNDALAGVVDVMLEQGQEIPEPFEGREWSGKLVLRMPPSLHARVVELASMEGVSINRFLNDAVSQYVGSVAAGR